MLVVNYNDPSLHGGMPDAGGGGTFFYNGIPFTGKIQFFHANGNIEAEEEYIDSYKFGRQIYYYENGQIEEDYYQKFNYFYGICKTFFQNGVLKNYIEYADDGRIVQEKHYDMNGALIGHWINGENML